jgi:hypothetical protein
MTLGYLSLRYMSMGIAPARARAYNPAMNAKNMLDLWDGSLCPALEEKIKSFNESNRLDKNREAKFRWDVPNAYLTLRYTLAEGAKLPNMTLTLDLSNCSIHAEYENVKNVKPVDLGIAEDNKEVFLKRRDGTRIDIDAASKYLLDEFLAAALREQIAHGIVGQRRDGPV